MGFDKVKLRQVKFGVSTQVDLVTVDLNIGAATIDIKDVYIYGLNDHELRISLTAFGSNILYFDKNPEKYFKDKICLLSKEKLTKKDVGKFLGELEDPTLEQIDLLIAILNSNKINDS